MKVAGTGFRLTNKRKAFARRLCSNKSIDAHVIAVRRIG